MYKESGKKRFQYELIYLDDMLIYSKTWASLPFGYALTFIEYKLLCDKMSKHEFGLMEIMYIGYIIW